MHDHFRLTRADWLTIANLLFGSFAILFVLSGKPMYAPAMIIIGSLFDLFDGWIARERNIDTVYGKAYDALADVITFGLAPAILVFWTSDKISLLALSAFVLYIQANIFRHVRIFGLKNKVLGPTNTSIALLISLIYLQGINVGLLAPSIVLLIGAGLMISERPYFSHHRFLKKCMSKPRSIFIVMPVLIITTLMIFLLPIARYVGMLVAVIYAISGQIQPLFAPKQVKVPSSRVAK